MSYVLNGPGPTNILSTTAQSTGSWYRVHPKMSNLTFQVVHTGTSVGATVGSTTIIEGSNDGVNALATPLGTVALSSNSGTNDGFTINAGWAFVRARVGSLAATSAGATVPGSYNLSVQVSASMRS